MRKGEKIETPGVALQLILNEAQMFRGNKLLTNKWLQQQSIHDIRMWVFEGLLFLAEEGDDGVDQ